jgi:hypothetical protein
MELFQKESETLSKAEAIPKWVTAEIQNAKFDQSEEWSGSGYLLDINKEERRVDIQFYDKLPDGRYIATLDVPPPVEMEALELAVVYMFKFKAFKATLSEKVVSFLKEKYALDMQTIYRFELEAVEKLDAEADASSRPPEPSEDDDESE